ncbi:MAG: ribosome biogenesis GTP-binding protein YihA/YsxC [Candidatus Absconditabacterales bacterium]
MEIISSTFIKSASKLSECPEANYPEFAFVGRSNVGKSSLINMLVGKKQLAKSSVTPGKTQLINYFLVNDARYLVDLPGYGYAKYSKEQRTQWMDTMQEYLTQRKNLKKIFVLVDGSIQAQKIDIDFMQVLSEEKLDFVVVVTKIDKATQKDLHKNIFLLKDYLQKDLGKLPEILLVSSQKGRGRDDFLDYLGNKSG